MRGASPRAGLRPGRPLRSVRSGLDSLTHLLAIGLSQVSVAAAAIVVGWLHLLAWREQKDLGRVAFNVRQLAVAAATVVAAFVLLAAVHQGLLKACSGIPTCR